MDFDHVTCNLNSFIKSVAKAPFSENFIKKYLVSPVSFLNANPRILIFFPETVLNNILQLSLQISSSGIHSFESLGASTRQLHSNSKLHTSTPNSKHLSGNNFHQTLNQIKRDFKNVQ